MLGRRCQSRRRRGVRMVPGSMCTTGGPPYGKRERRPWLKDCDAKQAAFESHAPRAEQAHDQCCSGQCRALRGALGPGRSGRKECLLIHVQFCVWWSKISKLKVVTSADSSCVVLFPRYLLLPTRQCKSQITKLCAWSTNFRSSAFGIDGQH